MTMIALAFSRCRRGRDRIDTGRDPTDPVESQAKSMWSKPQVRRHTSAHNAARLMETKQMRRLPAIN